MTSAIPTLDLDAWRSASKHQRALIGAELDGALRETGIFLLRGHRVPAELTDRMRAQGQAFFSIPHEQKVRYSVSRPYDNGWRGMGLIQSSAVFGLESAPDLHEAFHMGPSHCTGAVAFDRLYYPENKWPSELPEFRITATDYTSQMTRVAGEVLEVLAGVLGLPENHFTAQASRATWTQNINWYPSLRSVGGIQDGQMRVGPHTDFGSVTLLDRQPGVGGLEAWNETDGWFAPPFEPGTLVVNLGDLMCLWTDGRWRSLRHRVLAPSAAAPDEELVSLVFFFEADPDARIVPLPAPAGGGLGLAPVVAGESILEKVGLTLMLTD
jgi:validamycin A dioxygenase